MASDHRERLAALEGREFLPAAREMRQLMQRQIHERSRRQRWATKKRHLVRIENVLCGALILAAIAAVLFL